ncbi:hypothetical protein ABZW30_39150 [Kitasatospora sp. NPDC004669]|uniref:hypothetical protein n=1 Tax=Kitasatospora sp. NPDC004669 TaxID=3154555 RepID=UPI0033BDD033
MRARLYRVERSIAEVVEPELDVLELAAVADHLAHLVLFRECERGAVSASATGVLRATAGADGEGFHGAVVAAIEARPGRDLLTVTEELKRQPELKAVQRRLAARGLVRDEEMRHRLDRAVRWGDGSAWVTVPLAVVSVVWVAVERQNVLFPLGAFALLIGGTVVVFNRTFAPSGRHQTAHGDRLLRLASADDRWQDVQGQVALRGYHGLSEEHALRVSHRASAEWQIVDLGLRAADDRNGGGGV